MLRFGNSRRKQLPPAPSIFSLTDDEPTSDRAAFQYKLMMKYGDIVKTPGIYNYYAISHPDYIHQVLQSNFENYLKTDINFRGLSKVLGQGLLSNADLTSWSHHRKLVQPNFHLSNFPKYTQLITDCTKTMLIKWQDYAKRDKAFDVTVEMSQLALNIIIETLFSGDFKGHEKKILKYITLANHFMANGLFLFPWLPTPKNLQFISAKKALYTLIKSIIKKRREQCSNQEDLLNSLLAAQLSQEDPLSEAAVIDEVMTFLITGHESTGVALGWVWYCLANKPNELYKLQEELDTKLQGRTATYSDLPQLPYTRMVFEEVMRLYPPVWLTTRKAVAADQMGQYYIPANSTIIISPYVMHRHPKYWPNPEEFDPERHNSENSGTRPKYAYLPFGGGPRVCIGGSFVMVEALLIIATVAQHYQLTLVPKQIIQLLPQITLRAKHGIWMKVKPR